MFSRSIHFSSSLFLLPNSYAQAILCVVQMTFRSWLNLWQLAGSGFGQPSVMGTLAGDTAGTVQNIPCWSVDPNLFLFNRQHAYLARKVGNGFQCLHCGTHEGISRESGRQTSQGVQVEFGRWGMENGLTRTGELGWACMDGKGDAPLAHALPHPG